MAEKADILFKSTEEKFEYVLGLLVKPDEHLVDGNVQLRRYLESVKNHLENKLKENSNWQENSYNWLNANIKTLYSKNLESLDFGLKLLGILCRDELIFKRFLTDNVIEQVIQEYRNGKFTDIHLQLSYISLLRSISSHKSGLSIIKQHQLWKICFAEVKKTIYIVRESANLLYDVLLRLEEYDDETTCKQIIHTLLAPIVDDICFTDIIDVNDQKNYKALIMMLENLENLFLRMTDAKVPTKIAYNILITNNLQNKLWGALIATVDGDIQTKALRIQTYANVIRYAYMSIPNDDTECQTITVRKFCVNFFNMIGHCLHHRDPTRILMMLELTNFLCDKMGEKSPANDVSNGLTFGDQIIILQFMPLLHKIKLVHAQESQYLEEFMQKLFSTSCVQTVRFCYAFRDVISQTTKCYGELACKSVKGLIAMSNYLTRSRGILAFQALVLILQEYVPHTKTTTLPNGCKRVDLVLECSNLLSTIFSGLHTYVEKFNISWSDCMESVSIMHLSLALLNNPGLSGRLSVQALNLVRLAIEHFLSPNMILLMDNLEGSSLEKLGPTIVKRLQDNASEVRDTAAELVTSIVEISKSKFPGFKKHIIVNSICPLIVQLAETDQDVYVRASALKCLSNMVRIKQFWIHSFARMNLIERLMHVLRHEPEGRIRQEATSTLVSISAHQQLPADIIDVLFSTIAYLTTNDLYYAVKVQCIGFWRSFLEELFHNQGALDGKFPKETFSREHKKIVQLTPDEIRKRLSKIIASFEEKGGFGVLLAVLYEESDIEVLQACIALIKTFTNRLVLYKYEMNPKGIPMEVEQAITNFDRTHHLEGKICDAEINLLSSAYAKLEIHFQGPNHKYDEMDTDIQGTNTGNQIDSKHFMKYTQITGKDFIDIITKINLNQMVDAKSEWLKSCNGLDAALDDVILSFNAEKYDLDCY